ncbi:PucR family transcriptional regulator [Propionispora sp. 2/2-37]|uniref:PucR family transcriptional regulator n=1 Tax=Propionispora sp. 2/2-37 TaxID=1677858 RepID=UPI0006BB8EC7|nr:PucR family transcriptional regulator [Propionispora sp. 2/2-37]
MDLMELQTFQQLSLVGGMGGLDRIVRCPYVTLTNSIAKWVRGGELMFVSGIDLRCSEEELYNLLHESYTKNLAGVVILVRAEDTDGISPQLIELANQFCLPLFSMPYELPLVEIIEEINNFIIQTKLKEQFDNELMLMLFDSNGVDTDAVIARGTYYHYNLTGSHCVAVISMQNIQASFRTDEFMLVEKAMKYMESVRSLIAFICRNNGWQVLSMVGSGSVILLLPFATRQAVTAMLSEIKKQIVKNFDSPCIQIGVGQEYEHLNEVKRSRLEAERAVLAVDEQHDGIVFYQDLGMYKVLFEVGNEAVLQNYVEEILGKVLTYDKENHTHLLETLAVYLTENCNLVRTAERLYIHRNSLVYRIRKLEEVTGYDFSLAGIRDCCRQAILVANFLNKKFR